MRINNVVTIWHFDDYDTPFRKVFRDVCLDVTKKIDKNGIKQKGFFDGTAATVRIFEKEEINVSPGDYLYTGECFDAYPESDDCLKITEVKDNRRGNRKHWRIVCGG